MPRWRWGRRSSARSSCSAWSVSSLRRLRPPPLDGAKPAYAAEEWWRPTLPLTVIMIADNLMSRSAVIALGLTGNTRDAGIFAAAFSIATVTALPRMAVATAFAPTVSALFARGDQAGLQSLSAKAACLSLLGTACAAIPLLLLAKPILVWFGRDFVGRGPDRHRPRSRPDARRRMRASAAPHHDDWTRARRRNDFRGMRRLELRRLHADHQFVRNAGGRLRHDGHPYLLERGNGRLYPSMPAPHAGPGCFIKSYAGKKARGGLWGLICWECCDASRNNGIFRAGRYRPIELDE